MKSKILAGASLALVTIFLTGCVSASKSYLPDGSKGYEVTCNGTGRSWSDCYEKAAEVCAPSKFEVVDKAANEVGTVRRTAYFKCTP